MILDGHIHVIGDQKDRRSFDKGLAGAGVSGGIVMSIPPAVFKALASPMPARDRLDNLFYWTEGNDDLYPFFWIDPLEDDSLDQVALAVERGVMGFKVICSQHAPGHPRAMDAYRAIAGAGKPILFHSGILWDGLPSSPNNRPAGFEPLLEVEGLKFALAHISWPWYDECIAVYGKFLSAMKRRKDLSCEMFIDLTPGTPKIYRRDALTKLYTVGYDIENNIFWGSDNRTRDYKSEWVRQWIDIDREIFADLGLPDETREKAFSGNLRRFVGLADSAEKHEPAGGSAAEE
jgi:predicted TIM-barrel fold metal-dependent hydrolase